MNGKGRVASPHPPAEKTPAAGGRSLAGLFALLLVATLFAYGPSLRGEFLWDDPGHVTSPALQSWWGLCRIWFDPGATQQYYPFLHSAFWLEHRLWGDAAVGYRLVNVLWHVASACVFIAVLRRLAIPGALLAGVLFTFHPVCVESVAWISEQKNTLSTLFYLTAALAWLRFQDRPAPGRYAVATLCFLVAVLTKSVTATLPAALLVVAWWQHGRWSWRREVAPLLPWFVAGIGAGLFTAWFERTSIGAEGSDFNLGLVERGLLAGRVFWFYLSKLVWPAHLSFFYPRWHIDASAAWQYLFPTAAIGLVLGLAWWTRRGLPRGVLASVLLFAGTLVPVLGFVNVYPFVFSYVADHFQYLASLSLFAAASAGAVYAIQRVPARATRGAPVFVVALVGLYAVLTWQQSKAYVNSSELYRATLARNPDSWVAHHNYAMELANRGSASEALPHAQRALELKPDHAPALNNVADNLTRVGRPAEALPLLQRALQLQPRYAQAENNLGVALMALGRGEEGMRHFRQAIALDPTFVDAHYNLGLAEADRGDFAAAIAHFADTVRLRPDHAEAELKWGVALALSKGLAEAQPHFARALELEPESAGARQTYGRVLLNAGDLAGALAQLREALELDPALPGIHRDLAQVLQRLGRVEEARVHAAEASQRP